MNDKPANLEALEAALQFSWNDICGDSGCIPDAFRIHGPSNVEVTARFDRSFFVRHAAGALEADGYVIVPRGPETTSEDADRLEQLAGSTEFACLTADDRTLLLALARGLRQG